MAVRKKPNFIDDKIIPFIKKYGIFIIGLFVVFPYAYKYYKQMVLSVQDTNLQAEKSANANENGKSDPEIVKKKTAEVAKKYPKITPIVMAGLQSSAKGIAIAFGTNVEDNHSLLNQTIDLYNVNAWTEDEATAIKLLKQHTGTFPILEELYYKTATRSRNLVTDILKYLSTKQVEDLRKFYKTKGYNWL